MFQEMFQLIKSLQTVQKDVGNKKIVEFVENLGIKLKNNVAYESYAIGGLDEGVNTVQMAAAYAAFANGGYYTDPYTVKSITYRSNGKTEKFESKRKQAMKDSYCLFKLLIFWICCSLWI